MVVTLVLDCCFSANVYRHGDPSVRFLPYDVDASSIFLLEFGGNLGSRASSLASRDASIMTSWLINLDKHTLLVTCCPHE